MKNNEIRAFGITALFFLYLLGLPILKVSGLVAMTWFVALLPTLLPFFLLICISAAAIPYLIYMFVVELLNEFYPDKVDDKNPKSWKND